MENREITLNGKSYTLNYSMWGMIMLNRELRRFSGNAITSLTDCSNDPIMLLTAYVYAGIVRDDNSNLKLEDVAKIIPSNMDVSVPLLKKCIAVNNEDFGYKSDTEDGEKEAK